MLTPDDGMPVTCALNFDHVASAQRDRLGALICSLPDARWPEIRTALLHASQQQPCREPNGSSAQGLTAPGRAISFNREPARWRIRSRLAPRPCCRSAPSCKQQDTGAPISDWQRRRTPKRFDPDSSLLRTREEMSSRRRSVTSCSGFAPSRCTSAIPHTRSRPWSRRSWLGSRAAMRGWGAARIARVRRCGCT